MRDKFTRAYTYHADIYCLGCGEDLPLVDPENNERHPVASWELSEFDTATTCGGCHKTLNGAGVII